MQAQSRNDIAVLSNEWEILLECASSSPNFTSLQELLRHPDWAGLLDLAERHGVTNLVAARLCECGVPLGFQQQLRDTQRAHALSALGLIAEMLRVLDAFRAATVPALVLKGPALSLQAYGDASARQYGDVDLLVSHRDIYRATQIMGELGFAAEVPAAAVAAGKIPGEYLFTRPKNRAIVELHTERTLRYFPKRVIIEDIFQRRATLNIDGHELPTLSPEDALISACTHGAKHLWERLMWIADVAAIVTRQRNLDWSAAGRIAASLSAQRIVNMGLLLASELLLTPAPDPVMERARADRGASALATKVQGWLPAAGQASPALLQRFVFRMQMRGRFWPGIGYVTRLALSPTEKDWRKGQEQQHSRMRETARRLLRLAAKYGRNSNG